MKLSAKVSTSSDKIDDLSSLVADAEGTHIHSYYCRMKHEGRLSSELII
jgi:hypothetical protein